ncbi:MAG TPA: hypothetical protein VFW28_16725 [Micropepsaceae bacterium]|nr:hypothetical protein [Micropepsaceae bacterium]
MKQRFEKFASLRKLLEKEKARLKEIGEVTVTMSFSEIENCIGLQLPSSAYEHRAWWANGAGKVWQRAGFKTRDVDLIHHCVTFERKGPFSPEDLAKQKAKGSDRFAHLRQELRSWREKPMEAVSTPSSKPGLADTARPYPGSDSALSEQLSRCWHPLYGALRGQIRLVAGTDLTSPADPEWAERAWGDDKK